MEDETDGDTYIHLNNMSTIAKINENGCAQMSVNSPIATEAGGSQLVMEDGEGESSSLVAVYIPCDI